MKSKLTFIYDNGKTYTTSRNVLWTSDDLNTFIYCIGYKKDGIYKEEQIYLNKSDLVAVITHRDEDDEIKLKLFRKDLSYTVSVMQAIIDQEDDQLYTYVHNIGSRIKA